MGLVDTRYWRAGGFRIEDLLAAATADGPVYVDKQLVVMRTGKPLGLRFSGEIDITNSHAVGRSLAIAFPEDGHPHLDLTGLIFCDISGIRALVDAAESLGPNRRLMIHGLPQQIENVIRVTGWSERPSLILCDCEMNQP
jgi:anti-anti-sigma factor